jgi:hypothetical protein
MIAPMRRYFDRPRRASIALLLGIGGASGLACGEDVLVGRWLLRSSTADAGFEADAGPSNNPQSFNAEQARQHERERDANKNDTHDPRPADKNH